MPRFSLALAASLAVVVLAACGAGPVTPSASPSAPPASPSASPTIKPPPSVVPSPSAPAPTKPPVVVTPRPTALPPAALDFSPVEQYLLDGVRRGTRDCEPAAGSDEVPRDALGGIECYSTDPAVARIGFYLFANDEDMINAYLFRMKAEGVQLESGSCDQGEAEHGYIPDEGFAFDRAACFLNEEGFANYRTTMSGSHVYIGILGRSADMVALESFAWKGNQDMPGNPTLWFQPS